MAKRARISQNLLMKVIEKEGLSCLYCDDSNIDNLTVDHVLPVTQGGKNTLNNLTICCRDCNDKKRDLLLTQFLSAFEIKITPRIDRFL